MITLTSAEAQNNFGKLLDTAQREPVEITRHGRPTAYLVSAGNVERLSAEREKKREEMTAALKGWSEKSRKKMKPAALELTDEDIVRLVHELR